MGKLFGTDGIRGVANETLDTKLAYRIGQAAAISLQDGTGRKPTVVIGKDTRISSDMLEAALTAGLTACGCNVVTLGVIPTPAVAYLTVQLHADAGAVISASHNPYEHNGIKLFSREGFKLSDALEAQIENLILQPGELPVKSHGDLGQVTSGAALKEQYLDHLASTVGKLSGLRVLIDCANGAASPGPDRGPPFCPPPAPDCPAGTSPGKIRKWPPAQEVLLPFHPFSVKQSHLLTIIAFFVRMLVQLNGEGLSSAVQTTVLQ